MPDFGTYQGRPIRKCSLTVKGLGDGLSDALTIEGGLTLEPGESAFLLVEVEGTDQNHKYMKDGDAWNQNQVTQAVRGAIVVESVAKPLLDDVAIAAEAIRVAEGGDIEMDLEGEHAHGRLEEHARGLHKRKRKDCPACAGSDEAIAKVDELAAKRAEHGDGEGDAENPVPAARTRRSRAKGAAKKAGGRTAKKR